jgi:hypothetical protein
VPCGIASGSGRTKGTTGQRGRWCLFLCSRGGEGDIIRDRSAGSRRRIDRFPARRIAPDPHRFVADDDSSQEIGFFSRRCE